MGTIGDTSHDDERRRCGKQSDDLCVGNVVDVRLAAFSRQPGRGPMIARNKMLWATEVPRFEMKRLVGKSLLISWPIASAHESNRVLLFKILVA
jgi:hypothetical protein